MGIRDYWSLPPEQQAAMRAAVLVLPPRQHRQPVAVRAYRPPSEAVFDPFGYKAIYARDLLHGLGDVENVDSRSDDDCIEAAELLARLCTTEKGEPCRDHTAFLV